MTLRPTPREPKWLEQLTTDSEFRLLVAKEMSLPAVGVSD